LDSEATPFINAEEACAALGVKKATLYAYVSRGKLKSYRQGIRRERLYSKAELEALVGVDPMPVSTIKRSHLPRAEDWVAYV
jgi:excisionase family DNA binding protein